MYIKTCMISHNKLNPKSVYEVAGRLHSGRADQLRIFLEHKKISKNRKGGRRNKDEDEEVEKAITAEKI